MELGGEPAQRALLLAKLLDAPVSEVRASPPQTQFTQIGRGLMADEVYSPPGTARMQRLKHSTL